MSSLGKKFYIKSDETLIKYSFLSGLRNNENEEKKKKLDFWDIYGRLSKKSFPQNAFSLPKSWRKIFSTVLENLIERVSFIQKDIKKPSRINSEMASNFTTFKPITLTRSNALGKRH